MNKLFDSGGIVEFAYRGQLVFFLENSRFAFGCQDQVNR